MVCLSLSCNNEREFVDFSLQSKTLQCRPSTRTSSLLHNDSLCFIIIAVWLSSSTRLTRGWLSPSLYQWSNKITLHPDI